MIGAVLVVGEEILGGRVHDRNLAVIARALAAYGVELRAAETVGDNVEDIARAIRRLAGVARLLVVTGGLGPTGDDLTREGLARALDVGLREDAECRARLEAYLLRRGLASRALHYRQAVLPIGAAWVPNAIGSAPGIRAQLGACEIWALPGVPEEARAMLQTVAESLGELSEGHLPELFVATTGVREVEAAEMLDAHGFHLPEAVKIGYLPGLPGVRLRFTGRGGIARALAEEIETTCREIFGWRALPRETLEGSLVHELGRAGLALAAAESCTGGLLGARITSVAGASAVYLGGIVAYSNRAKLRLLQVPEEAVQESGAVSEPVARAMAEGVRSAFEADLGLSVTGIAGPSGGTPEKPVGTVWIGLSERGSSATSHFRFSGDREAVRERAVCAALEMAYRRVREKRS
jgi:nicotinamide-nucleotide amidase